MSDVWEAFGIRSLSPSQLAKWSECRGMWYAKSRAKIKEDAGPAAWRGDAIELGLLAALQGRPNAHATAMQAFEARALEYAEKHDGELHEKHDEEEGKIGPALTRAIQACEAEGIGAPKAHNPPVEAMLPGVSIKVFGKPDFTFEANADCGAHCVDLKTSGQIPSKPKDANEAPKAKTEHAIAASLYAFARKEKLGRILYISTAGNPRDAHRLITLDAAQIDFYVNAAVQIAKQIEATLTAALAMQEFECVTAEQALAELCRPNMLAQGGGIYPVWKSDFAREAAQAVPAWKLA